VNAILKRNSKLVLLGITFTAIIFLGLFPSQALAYKYKKDPYWPDWDKWREATPESQGMDSNMIEYMYNFIEQNLINIQSMLIVRNGYIVNEEYLYQSVRQPEDGYIWPGHIPDWDLHEGRLHHVFSVTKSITSLLTGIAIEMGYIDLDTKFFDVFPDKWDPLKYSDPGKRDITVEHLLLQNVGIDFDEFDPETAEAWIASGLSIDFYLTHPMVWPSGYGFPYYFIYASANHDLLSVMIANKTGMPLADFARKYLFKPLKIRDSEWWWMSTPSAWGKGDLSIKYQGGFGLFMSHQAMARIGLMCLNEGKWRGRQVVPQEWISDSTNVQITPGGSLYYGYLWWITPTEYPTPYPPFPDTRYYQAMGLAGQRIIVIPECDMVVAITANLPGMDDWYWYGTPYSFLVETFIIPSVFA
jgi:CubicO group peptidase (beta-lactamase class C family)